MLRRNLVQFTRYDLSSPNRLESKFVPEQSLGRIAVLRIRESLNTIAEIAQCRRCPPLADSNLSLRQCRSMCGLDLPCHAGIALSCGFLNVLSIENEVIPVNAPSFENRHFYSPVWQRLSSKRDATAIRTEIRARIDLRGF